MSLRRRFSVHARTAAEVVAELPRMHDFDGKTDPIDVLILASGFEERVVAVPRAILNAGGTILGPTLMGRYRTNREDNERREAELMPILSALGRSPPITFDADSPESILEVIRSALAGQRRGAHVAFDISGASSTLILSAMAALLRSGLEVRLSIFYAFAAKYHEPHGASRDAPPIAWSEADLSEFGVSEVETNELYPGIHHDLHSSFVIALPSMFPARLRRCLGHLGIEPLSGAESQVHWILPRTDNPDHTWRQKAVRKAVLNVIYGEQMANDLAGEIEVSSELPGSNEFIDVGDYRSCLRSILEMIDSKAGKNLSIVNLGTKVQSVGVALAMAARSEVALVTARPKAFAANTYSEGIGRLLTVTFDDVVGIVQRLGAVGTLSVEMQ